MIVSGFTKEEAQELSRIATDADATGYLPALRFLSVLCALSSRPLREIERALDTEAGKILASIPQGAYTIALCVEGKELSSEGLAEVVGRCEDESGKLALVIGSSHGLSPKVKAAAALRLSFSRLTFPHQLIRVNLYEAIYRSFTILHKKRYHK